VTVRLPIEGDGERPVTDPVKLVTDRAGESAAAAKVKKSA